MHASEKNMQCNWSTMLTQAPKSNCLKQELSNTKENRHCTPCMRLRKQFAIQLINNIYTSTNIQLPQAPIFNLKRKKKTLGTMRASENNMQSNWLRIFPQAQNSNRLKQEISITKDRHTIHYASRGNNLQSTWSRIFPQTQNPNCLNQVFSITKENRHCTPCVPW